MKIFQLNIIAKSTYFLGYVFFMLVYQTTFSQTIVNYNRTIKWLEFKPEFGLEGNVNFNSKKIIDEKINLGGSPYLGINISFPIIQKSKIEFGAQLIFYHAFFSNIKYKYGHSNLINENVLQLFLEDKRVESRFRLYSLGIKYKEDDYLNVPRFIFSYSNLEYLKYNFCFQLYRLKPTPEMNYLNMDIELGVAFTFTMWKLNTKRRQISRL